MDEPKAMREIHEIREKFYEETKNMTPAEINTRVQESVDRVLKNAGYKLEPVEGEPKAFYMVQV